MLDVVVIGGERKNEVTETKNGDGRENAQADEERGMSAN